MARRIMTRAARAGQQEAVEMHESGHTAARLVWPGCSTVGCRVLNRDGPKDTAIAINIAIVIAAAAMAIASVRAIRLAGRLGMQLYAGRASPSKIPGWIESHAPSTACKLTARTDPHDPDPDPGVRSTPGMRGCLPPPPPAPTAGRFWFGKKIASCRFRPGHSS